MKNTLKKDCIACDKKKWSLYAVVKGAQIWECQSCGLGFTVLPKKVTLDELYGEQGSYHLEEYKKVTDEQQKKIDRITAVLKRVLAKGSVLEIGGGYGLFANELSKKKEYVVSVIEPYLEPLYLKKNKKVTVYKETVQSFLKTKTKKYDAVFLLDVLEHFDNPEIMIEKIKKLLSPNGNVIIQLPNYDSVMADVLKEKWSFWMVEDHKYHFTPYSLNLFLTKHGLTVHELQTYELRSDFRKQLDGLFSPITNASLRKLSKALLLPFFYGGHVLFSSLIWSNKRGGLILLSSSVTSAK